MIKRMKDKMKKMNRGRTQEEGYPYAHAFLPLDGATSMISNSLFSRWLLVLLVVVLFAVIGLWRGKLFDLLWLFLLHFVMFCYIYFRVPVNKQWSSKCVWKCLEYNSLLRHVFLSKIQRQQSEEHHQSKIKKDKIHYRPHLSCCLLSPSKSDMNCLSTIIESVFVICGGFFIYLSVDTMDWLNNTP